MAAARVSRPDSVKVGMYQYDILWYTQDEWDAERLLDTASGATYASQKKIYILLMADSPETNYQEVVLHEILHAVWDLTMLTHYHSNVEEGEREEYLVGTQAPALVTVLKDNPALVKWLQSDGSHRR